MSSLLKKKLSLMSSDGIIFEVDEEVAAEIGAIKTLIKEDCTHGIIPLANINGDIISLVIEYCRKRSEANAAFDAAADEESMSSRDTLKAWDAEFMRSVDNDKDTLYDLILAANYLNIESLLDLTIMSVVNLIKGKSPEDMRREFNLKNDFTPEEEEKYRKEREWAFQRADCA